MIETKRKISKFEIYCVLSIAFIILLFFFQISSTHKMVYDITDKMLELEKSLSVLSDEVKGIKDQIKLHSYESSEAKEIIIDVALRRVMNKSNPKLTAKEKSDYIKYIVRNSKRTGLSPIFIAAVIHRETNFDKNSVSKVGAKGPMQVLPTSHRNRLRKLDLSEEQLQTIEYGIYVGCDILAEYVAAEKNNLRMGLYRYVGVKHNYKTAYNYVNDIFAMVHYAIDQ